MSEYIVIAAWLLYIVAVFLDVILFIATPHEARPWVWWRYWPGSGFIIYTRYKQREPQGDGSK